MLSLYKKVLALRHTNRALLDGTYTALNEDDVNVMSYLRSYKGKAVLVALNMSAVLQKISFDFTARGFSVKSTLTPLITSGGAMTASSQVSLKPFGFMIAEVNP